MLSRQTAELDADHREYVVRELAYRHNLRNILYLARTEFAVLEQPLDWAELAPLIAADRVRARSVLFCAAWTTAVSGTSQRRWRGS